MFIKYLTGVCFGEETNSNVKIRHVGRGWGNEVCEVRCIKSAIDKGIIYEHSVMWSMRHS